MQVFELKSVQKHEFRFGNVNLRSFLTENPFVNMLNFHFIQPLESTRMVKPNSVQ